MLKNLHCRFLFILFSVLLFQACNNKEGETRSDFDRREMLENIGSNIILSNYQQLQLKTEALQTKANHFADHHTDATQLAAIRAAFKEAYLAWQAASPFEFGPAADLVLGASMNTFPVDTTKVNNNIRSGSYNMAAASNLTAKGFPAIDYLLYSTDSSAVLASFTTNPDAANRKAYLKAVIAEIASNSTTVNNAWKSGYLTTFVDNAGTDMGSSLGMLVNQLNQNYEMLKNYKIGVPLGVRTLGVAMPEKVEAYYSGISLALANANLHAIENLYLGRSGSVDGSGLDDYLVKLDARHNSGSLNDAIRNQLNEARLALQAVPDPLSNTIAADPAVVQKAYTELQKQVVLFKSDMPSAMGVLITYQDNDGD
jgi:predicted lipoprotein